MSECIDIELVTGHEMASAIEAVRTLHQPKTRRHRHYRSGESFERVTCEECNHKYPCPTALALRLPGDGEARP